MKRTIFRRCLLSFLVLVCLLQTTIGAFEPYEESEILTGKDLEVIELMTDLNIMHGDGSSFRPHDAITREEMFRVIYTISVGGSSTAPSSYYSKKLKAVQGLADVDDVAAWALPYAGYCFFNKLFVGNTYGELAPKSSVSYYDCAVVLLKLLGLPSSALGPGNAATSIAKFGLAVGLFDDLEITDIYAPMTRLEVARMISAALKSRCIAEVSNGTLRYAAVDGLRRWFDTSSVEKLKKSGVVIGQTQKKGNDYLVVSSGKNTLYYPAAGVSYGSVLGKIVCWSEKSSGEILSPIRPAAEPYTSSLRDLPPYRQQDGGVVIGTGEAKFVFDRNLLSGRNVWLYNTVTAEFDRSRTFLTATSLVDYLQSELGTRWGKDTVISLSASGDDLVVRLTPLAYLRYDRASQTASLNGTVYPTDETFDAVPDGSIVAAFLDKAMGTITLHGLPMLVDVSSKAFRVESDANGNYSFFLHDQPVRNRTELMIPVSDAELAAKAGVSGKLVNYVLCDDDGIVGAGAFDEYRIPFTDVPAYVFVERTEKLTIGSRRYTAIFGFINGKPGCELIDDAFGVPTLGENRLLYLSVETTPLGESAVRPQGVSAELNGMYGSTGFGTVTTAVFASGNNRKIVVGETELLLADDCAVACADADGTPDTFQLENILIFDGRAYDDQAGRTFRAVYGVNADGAVEWLLLVRSKAN